MSQINTLIDNFDDNSLDTNKWVKFEAGSALVFERNARLEIAYPAASTATTDGDITSKVAYDLTASAAFIKVIQMPKSTTNANGIFRIYTDVDNWFQFIYEAGTLYIQRRISGSTTTIVSFTYSPVDHAWLQLREQNGLIYWETSASGAAWTQRATYTYGITITAMKVMLAGTCYQAETSPGFFIIDSFNTSAIPAEIPKTHMYKVSKLGSYLGLLPAVKSPFGYTQIINTGGAQLTVMVGQSPDNTHDDPAVIPLIGDASSLIQNGNTLEVVEVSTDYPNGKTVFMGFMDTYTANFGGTEDVRILALSDGADLDNYPITTGESTDVVQALDDSSYDFGATQAPYKSFVQQITVGGGVTDMSSIDLKIRRVLANAAAGTIQVALHQTSGGAKEDLSSDLLGVATNSLVQNDTSDTAKIYNFSFSGGIAVTGGNYYVKVKVTAEVEGADAPYQLFYKAATNPLATGDLFINAHNAADSGYRTPTTTPSPGSFNDWANPTNGFTEDGTFATSVNLGTDNQDYGGFGFDAFLPSGETSVDTVSVIIKGKTSAGTDDIPVRTSGTGDLPNQTFTTVNTQYVIPTASYLINHAADAYIDSSFYATVTRTGGPTHTASLDGIQIKITTSAWSTNAVNDLYIKTYFSGGGTTAVYSGVDPTSIVRDTMDNYANQGGLITYDSSTTDLTGESVSYTFNLNTTLESIKKSLELAPADFYWYVDPATRMLYFKQTATTAKHILVIGKHIEELNLEATNENVRNVVYFSGGDDGTGVNILVVRTNPTSIAAIGRQLLERLSDSNVHDTATAITLADNFLDANASETYQTPITIPASLYDITKFYPGDTVGFVNSSHDFINALIVQIAGLERNASYAKLTLGRLPDKTSALIEANKRAIMKLQTVDNPNSPT